MIGVAAVGAIRCPRRLAGLAVVVIEIEFAVEVEVEVAIEVAVVVAIVIVVGAVVAVTVAAAAHGGGSWRALRIAAERRTGRRKCRHWHLT